MLVHRSAYYPRTGMPRWQLPDELKLEPKGTVLKSQITELYYHSNPSGRNPEVRGPYRTRRLAIDAFNAYKAEMLTEIEETRREVTKGRTGERAGWSKNA